MLEILKDVNLSRARVHEIRSLSHFCASRFAIVWFLCRRETRSLELCTYSEGVPFARINIFLDSENLPVTWSRLHILHPPQYVHIYARYFNTYICMNAVFIFPTTLDNSMLLFAKLNYDRYFTCYFLRLHFRTLYILPITCTGIFLGSLGSHLATLISLKIWTFEIFLMSNTNYASTLINKILLLLPSAREGERRERASGTYAYISLEATYEIESEFWKQFLNYWLRSFCAKKREKSIHDGHITHGSLRPKTNQ